MEASSSTSKERYLKNKKSEIRSLILEKLKSEYFTQQRHSISLHICNKIENNEAFRNALSVGLYVPLCNEVDVTSLIDKYHKTKRILLPKILPKGEMTFVSFNGWDKMEVGEFGIKTPCIENLSESKQIAELIIVPALAFDIKGFRLGRGGGYYDRYLKKYKSKTIGISLYPILDDMPRNDWDVPVDDLIIYSAK